MSFASLPTRSTTSASIDDWQIALSGSEFRSSWLIQTAAVSGPRRLAEELLNSQQSQTMGASGGPLYAGGWKAALIGGALLLLQPQMLAPVQWTRQASNVDQARAQYGSTRPHQDVLAWVKGATGLAYARIGELVGVTRQTVYNWTTGSPI